jgi:23S rRNA (adenine2503-C2)-methyltransferase
METDKLNIKDMEFRHLEHLLVSRSKEQYRAKQIWDWLYKKQVTDIDLMTNLPKELRQFLQERFHISRLALADRKISRDGSQKFCFRLEDGYLIEAVWIKMVGHSTLCLSSQVGCRLGCDFCLTGKKGLVRNLQVSEVIDQVLSAQALLKLKDQRYNLVFMGMGEPLDNYDNIIKALRIITASHGLAISPRRITLSTVGLINPLIAFSQEALPVNLAISLNATTDRIRAKLMPINKNNPIGLLLQVLRNYPLPPRRRITIQYVLMEGINDSAQDALRLVHLLKGLRCKINLIPLNGFSGSGYRAPRGGIIAEFQSVLQAHNYTALIRESKGSDIYGACGQLGGGINKWMTSPMP